MEKLDRKRRKEGSFTTIKLIFFAVVAIPLNTFWVIHTGYIGYGINFTRFSFFMNVVSILFILCFLNALLKRFLPSVALTKTEMLLLYAMLSISTGLAGHDLLQHLYPGLGHAFYYATPENEWKIFHPYIPRWLAVSDWFALEGYYTGGDTLYTQRYIMAWLVPSIAWAIVTIAAVLFMLCATILVRRQWIDHERLSYPLAQIPLEMIDKGASLFKSRLLWIGFGLAAGRTLINGLHYIYPNIPSVLSGEFSLRLYFTTRPWNALGSVSGAFHPFAIGLAYFMPLEMSFSMWFFYWVWRFERVFGSVVGVSALRGFPFEWEQAVGVIAAILLFSLWMYRFQALSILKSFFGHTEGDPVEFKRYRWAVLGLLLSFGYLVGFMTYVGMKVWIAAMFFLVFFSISMVITRIRAEVGYPMHEGVQTANILVTALGTRPIGRESLTLLPFLYFLTSAHRSSPQPYQLETFKMAERMRLKADRILIWGMVLAIIIGTFAACWAVLHSSYQIKGGPHAGTDQWSMFNQLTNRLIDTHPPDVPALIAMGFGTFMGFFLLFMHRFFIWWPFHPMGYLLGGPWPSSGLLWFSMFISWLSKWIILKFGGLALHRRASVFFIGLVLGDFVMVSFWGLLGTILGKNLFSRFI